jgi:hypothetical protein
VTGGDGHRISHREEGIHCHPVVLNPAQGFRRCELLRRIGESFCPMWIDCALAVTIGLSGSAFAFDDYLHDRVRLVLREAVDAETRFTEQLLGGGVGEDHPSSGVACRPTRSP